VNGSDIKLFADMISDRLEISCAALSGANIANEVAKDRFSETTIGVRKKEDADMWKKLFSRSPSGRNPDASGLAHPAATPKFRVSIVDDVRYFCRDT
jgi:glycerol-3-phosphate dehydrogenase (NAD+)